MYKKLSTFNLVDFFTVKKDTLHFKIQSLEPYLKDTKKLLAMFIQNPPFNSKCPQKQY